MGLRIGLKETSSFVRLWGILMCYISLKFQFKNYFLNLWKLTHEWCVQRNKGISKNRFKIEISIKILGYSVKFNVPKKKERQKINGPQRNVILLPRLDLEKNYGTLRWLILQNLRLSRKCVRWKAIFFGPEGMIGKSASGKLRVFPGATSWRELRQSKVGLVNSPGRTVRTDIHLDIHNMKDVRVELSVQPRISVLNRAPISIAPLSAWISVLRISERGFYCGYPWLHG